MWHYLANQSQLWKYINIQIFTKLPIYTIKNISIELWDWFVLYWDKNIHDYMITNIYCSDCVKAHLIIFQSGCIVYFCSKVFWSLMDKLPQYFQKKLNNF